MRTLHLIVISVLLYGVVMLFSQSVQPYRPPSFVWGRELVVTPGTLTYQLPVIPVANSVRLYLNGSRLSIIRDYTQSGATITLNIKYAPAPGEVNLLIADYLQN